MNVVNHEHLNQIREKPILENALSMYYLYERKFQKGKMEIKWLYIKIGNCPSYKSKPILTDG